MRKINKILKFVSQWGNTSFSSLNEEVMSPDEEMKSLQDRIDQLNDAIKTSTGGNREKRLYGQEISKLKKQMSMLKVDQPERQSSFEANEKEAEEELERDKPTGLQKATNKLATVAGGVSGAAHIGKALIGREVSITGNQSGDILGDVAGQAGAISGELDRAGRTLETNKKKKQLQQDIENLQKKSPLSANDRHKLRQMKSELNSLNKGRGAYYDRRFFSQGLARNKP